MDSTQQFPDSTSHTSFCPPDIWLAATIATGKTIYHRTPQPGPHEPGTLREQLEVAKLAAENPWNYADPDDAYAAARRTVLSHAKRRAR